MDRLQPILQKEHFKSFLIIEENKIDLSKVNNYKKIEFILELTEFMNLHNIKYHIDKDLNILVDSKSN